MDAGLLDSALEYARAGRAVFPVDGKEPYTRHGFKDATQDEDQIRRWWSTWPNAGIATPTGSGQFVLDIDNEAAVNELPGGLPPTVEALTGGGGRHLWFTHHERLTNSPGRLPQGIHFRGDGGYVVLPPSPHPDGGEYEWRTAPDEHPMTPIPSWLLELLKPSQNGAAPAVNGGIPQNDRNNTLTSLAGSMRCRGMTENEILAALRETNKRCQPPLGDREVAGIARSVVRYEPTRRFVSSYSRNETTNSRTPLRELDVERFTTEEPEPIDWLGEGVIARGKFTLPGGREKTGKSLLMMRIAVCMASGGGFVADIAVKPGRVVIIDGENGEEEIHRRLRSLGLRPEHVSNIKVYEARGFELREHVGLIAKIIEEFGPDFVLLDSYRTLWRGRERQEDEVPEALDPLRQLAHDTSVALALIHHAQKDGDEYRGSTAIGACVDWLVMLRRLKGDDDQTRRLLTNPLARFAPERPPRWLSIASDGDEGPITVTKSEPFESAGPKVSIERVMRSIGSDGEWHKREEAVQACEDDGVCSENTFKDYFPSQLKFIETKRDGRNTLWRITN
jgi:Bifunctional DNA primase/polymerase, N-terminal/AAA domain/Primase C terminal 1 (PriCT-1)